MDPIDQQPDATPAQPRPQIQIDDSKVIAAYSNFCRVTGTPEELIIDFGLNPQPFGVPTEPIPVTQRIVTNFYTAKRMLHLANDHPAPRGDVRRTGDRRAEAGHGTAGIKPPGMAHNGPGKPQDARGSHRKFLACRGVQGPVMLFGPVMLGLSHSTASKSAAVNVKIRKTPPSLFCR